MKSLEKLKTFEGACKIEGLDPKKVIPTFSKYPAKDRKAMIAHAKLVIIVKAANRLANEGKVWVVDFDNGNQVKYYPWWTGGSSGFRFGGYGYWGTDAYVGSRLCFISSEACEYVAKKFIALYKEYLL
jgi:hypothetical protein